MESERSKTLEEFQKKETELQSALRETNTNLTQTTQDYHQSVKVNERLQSQLKTTQGSLIETQAILNHQREAATRAELNAKALQTQLKETQSSLLKTDAKLSDARKAKSDFQNRLDSLYIEKNVSEKQFRQKLSAAEENRVDLAVSLKAAQAKSAKILKESEIRETQLQKEKKDLHNRLSQKSQEHLNAVNAKDTLRKELTEVRSQLGEAKLKVEESEKVRKDYQERLDNIYIEKNILKIENEKLVKARESLSTKAVSERKELEAAHQAKISLLRQSNKDLTAKIKNIESSGRGLQQKLQTTETTLLKTRQKEQLARENVMALEKTIKDLSAEKSALYRELDHVNSELTLTTDKLQKFHTVSPKGGLLLKPLTQQIRDFISPPEAKATTSESETNT